MPLALARTGGLKILAGADPSTGPGRILPGPDSSSPTFRIPGSVSNTRRMCLEGAEGQKTFEAAIALDDELTALQVADRLATVELMEFKAGARPLNGHLFPGGAR